MAEETFLGLGSYVWLAGSIVLVLALACSKDLRSTIWHARLPVAFAVFACVTLAGPEQTRFLVAGIDSLTGGIALLLAVLVTGIGVWFWARWSLNLAWQAGLPGVAVDGFWWRWVRRIVAVAPAVSALLCLAFSARMMSLGASISLGLGLLAVAGLLIALALARRSHIRGRARAYSQPDRFAWFFAGEALGPPAPNGPRGLGGGG